MPQLSLYVDEKTLRMIEKAAKEEQVSISKFARNIISKSIKKDWPQNYFDLFGSIKDDSFERPSRIDYEADSAREGL